MQWLISKLASACENLGLTIILTKTKPVWVSRMSAKPLNFKLGDHTFDVVAEFTSVSPSPRTWALTQKSPEESAKPPAPCPIWLRKLGITNTWLGTPKCTTTTHAFSAVWWHPLCKTRQKKIFIVNVPKIAQTTLWCRFSWWKWKSGWKLNICVYDTIVCSVIRVSVCLHYSERVRQCGGHG